MDLKPRKETIYGQKEFLRNNVGTQFKTGGITLDGSAFPDNAYVKAGTAVYRGAEGLYLPVAAGTLEATIVAGVLTSHDVKVVDGSNSIVGGLMAGHPLESKCTGVTAAFKAAVKNRLHFDL